ncbi:similar to Saccharomyces cerevisiae YER011W TIR1 Cell wall mannoprotein of the Srp1p/Tip1p family of serine-alanine-rich proteins [Maudiozyma saulgeensis]|uniref:Similar to Saccharomyces cerevisiae YER011W TIR1 Cell wall mannoprotein of the Srp1p/Tip1p family of serine-alanine-rich proteins n=1 Tax=Maudiozyma saulgeensis TaxID=1789683 RepID=A0A1X7R2V3_9SACH|nr:similar to Saccharomyces cerevisiae YER011W TIR1 Cell wall mannoprotein of the Srp1p/Tip1p family of serine-alanine-rich proteins [Kazachstania saulgeensis]
MYAKTLLFLAAAALANAQTAAQIAELNVIIADVKDNMADYTSLATSGSLSLSDLPTGIMPLAMAVQTATDDSYTTLYSNVDFDAVATFLTKLPWYSSRLEAAIESATAAVGGDETTSTAVAAATSSITSVVDSSAAVTGTAATETAYSFRNTTVTVCEATSCHVTYVTETVCNHPEICQAKTTIPATTVTETICTHPEVCGYKNGTQTSATGYKNGTSNGAGKTTAGLQQQTANGAVKAVAGLGAGALAAAALLL